VADQPDPSVEPGRQLPMSESLDPVQGLLRRRVIGPPPHPGIMGVVGHFELIDILGIGGMGIVFLARDAKNGNLFAIKVLRPDLLDAPELVHRFLVEAQHQRRMSHPNILPVLEVSEASRQPYFVMPLIAEGSLAKRLAQKTPLGYDATLEIVSGIAEALAYAHSKGIIHRDLKPGNVLLCQDGRACLADFGLARTVFNDSVLDVRQNQSVGTPAYMSPAVAAGEAEDTRCDIYSLGAMLYEMLTGRPPYVGRAPEMIIKQILAGPPEPITKLNPKAPPGLVTIAEGCMAREHRDRYASMNDVVADLRRVAEGSSPVGPHGGTRRRRLRPVAIIAATLCIVGLALVVNHLVSPSNKNQIPATPAISKAIGESSVGNSALVPETPVVPKTYPPPPLAEAALERWIETPGGIGGICLSPDGQRLYAAFWGNSTGCPIMEYEVSSGKLLRTFHYDDHHCHGDVVVSKDGRFLYTTNYYFTYASRLDLEQGGKEATCDVGGVRNAVWAGGIDITPDKKLVAVAVGQDGRNYDMKNKQISLINVADGAFDLASEVKLPDEPVGHKMGFSADSRFLYVVTRQRQSQAPRLYEISLGQPYQVKRWADFTNGELTGVAVCTTRDKIFVGDAANKKIWVLDRSTFKTTSAVDLAGAAPGTLLISPDDKLLYALSPATRSLWIVNTESELVLAQLKGLRREARSMELTADGTFLFVSHYSEDGGIAVIRLRPGNTGACRPVEGVITFSSDRERNYQIFRMDATGKNIQRLTNNNATEKAPRWSPDGKRIAFISDRQGPFKVFIMNEDGANAEPVPNTDPQPGDVNGGAPLDWSPDGTQIVFVNANHTAIRVVNVDGSESKTVVQGRIGKGYDYYPGVSWRRDNNTILFNAENADWAYNQDIFSVNPVTQTVTQITNTWGTSVPPVAPDLAPDGRKIAVVIQPSPDIPVRNIYVMDRNGGGLAPLTALQAASAVPRWSPSGERIVFCSGTVGKKQIWIMHADGTHQEQLTTGDSDNIEPDIK